MNEIFKRLAEIDPQILIAEGLDDALLGYVERAGEPPAALYDADKCIEILTARGMSEEIALEHFYHNIQGGFVGKYSPAFASLLR